MEEHNHHHVEHKEHVQKNNQTQIAGAIVIAGLLIAGAVLLKGNTGGVAVTANTAGTITLAPVTPSDRKIGNIDAKVDLVMYEDFQCPFCDQFFKNVEQNVEATYVKAGTVQFVYRDYAFLGAESVQASEAARCAEDQGKFWEYHDYLFNHQNGENKGGFSDTNLKSFAKALGLDTATFNSCLSSNKYGQVIADAKAEASKAGVTGTPKGFLVTQKDISTKTQAEILKALNVAPGDRQPISFYTTKNIVSLNGALPWTMVKSIIDTSDRIASDIFGATIRALTS